MFCVKCGNQIPEGETTCHNCGTVVGAGKVYLIRNSNPYVSGIGSMVKNFFSRSPNMSMDIAAKNATPYWAVMLIVSMLLCGLSSWINCLQFVGRLLNKFNVDYSFSDLSDLGGMYVYGCFIYAIGFAAVFGGIMIVVKIYGKKVSFNCVGNVVAAASLPLTLVYIINMLLGGVFPKLVICTTLTAILMSTVLLYLGVQKLDKPDTFHCWPFFCVLFCASIIVLVFISLFAKGLKNNITHGLMGEIFSYLNFFY